MSARMNTRCEGVKITWKGKRELKDGKTFEIVQCLTVDKEGFVSVFTAGGRADLLKTLERNEVVNLDVATRAVGDNLYVDIIGVERMNTGKSAGVKV